MSTTRWFSANPSDSTSRWTPCPPKYCKRWLQVRLGCLQLSLSCPYRLLHTFLFLWPVRRYPHFWISARGLELSGTLTRLRYKLPGTHYPSVRLPVVVHWRLRSSDFPPRPVTPCLAGGHGISRFSREVCLCMQRVCDRAWLDCLSPWRGSECCLPLLETASAPRTRQISRLHSSPALPPVNASPLSLRTDAHDSGPA